MTARVGQGVIQVVAHDNADARISQSYVQIVAQLTSPVSMARMTQGFLQVIARTYPIINPARPGPDIVQPGVHDRFTLPTMGSMNNED